MAGSGQAKGQSLERLSSDHQITPPPHTPASLWAQTCIETAHCPQTLKHLESHHHPVPPLPSMKTLLTVKQVKPSITSQPRTHTGWYYYHVKVRFTSKYSNTIAQIYVNNCCAHAHTVYKHTKYNVPQIERTCRSLGGQQPITTTAGHRNSQPRFCFFFILFCSQLCHHGCK